jgi:4-hydroxy-tetrahydrodipicolinate synthase
MENWMTEKVIHGVSAAVLTPRLEDDSVDVAALRALMSFLIDKGISSFAINGATGEFCLTTPEQLEVILQTVSEVSGGKAEVVCGVGAAGLAGVRKLVRVAESARVNALLLPMPYFFPYEQNDLEIFCRSVAESTALPILLYNLPQFTSGLQSETVRRLITEVANIVGIKDSSGSLEILRDLRRHEVEATCIIGNDSVFALGLQEGVCDGAISGVACVLPEVIRALYAERERQQADRFSNTARLLDEFIAQLNCFPTPWGLKWAAEARGITPARFALPVAKEREAESVRFRAWLRDWLPAALGATL